MSEAERAMSEVERATSLYTKRTLEERAALNEELGFYPAKLDGESVAEYRRQEAEDRFRHARWAREHGGPGGSHWNQFRNIVKRTEG
jgi:hypothetical protein